MTEVQRNLPRVSVPQEGQDSQDRNTLQHGRMGARNEKDRFEENKDTQYFLSNCLNHKYKMKYDHCKKRHGKKIAKFLHSSQLSLNIE